MGGLRTGILIQCRPPKASLKDPYRRQHEPRPDLDQRRDRWSTRLKWILFDDLIVSEPDLVVEEGKGEDVIDEGFQAARGRWDREALPDGFAVSCMQPLRCRSRVRDSHASKSLS